MRGFLFLSLVVLSLPICRTLAIEPDFEEEFTRLHQVYLDGGPAEVRESLAGMIAIFEEDPDFSPSEQASGLSLSYGQLHVFEQRTGDAEAARAALIKARYWTLRQAELSGCSPAEAMRHVEKFASEEGVVAFIDKWDREHNDGRLPRYARKP